MFKIRKKQKSAPKRIVISSNEPIQEINRYRCLKQISDTEDHWKRLVQNQLQMGSTIVAFQNVEISMRVDAHKKLMLRQTFMLKKEIIRLIVNQKYDQILQKLQILRKTSSTDNILASLFIDFYHIRQSILSVNLEYKYTTVTKIKQKIVQYHDKIERQKGSIIFGRILYITALHLIKLDGVLIKNEDIGIVVQALNSKKKQLCMLTSQINKVTLQSLLFLTFQFYKILYLLKRDQDLMTQYYNQIQAYISIYRTKCRNFDEFQKNFKIAERMQKMQPLNLNLKIYDDHDRRRVLSLQNTQYELMKNHYASRNGNVLVSQINAEISNNKKTLNRINSFQSQFQKQELSESKVNGSDSFIIKDMSNYASRGGIQEKNLSQNSRFCFEFIKPDDPVLFKGKFQVSFSEGLQQIEVMIKIIKRQQVVGIFRLTQNGNEKKRNLGEFAKKLWRVIKQTFYIDKTQFLPNLFSFEYPPFRDIPKQINKTFQLPILVRIHQILLHYLRKQSQYRKINGQIILFPDPKAQSQKKLNDPSQAEYKIFAKRHGFISFNKKIRSIRHKNNLSLQITNHPQQKQLDQQLYITFVSKQQNQYCLISAWLSQNTIKNFYLINLNLKNVKYERNEPNLKENLLKLYHNTQALWRSKRIKKIVQVMEDYKYGEQYFIMDHEYFQRKIQNSSIQEEFQVMKSPVLQTRHNEIKTFKRQNKNVRKTDKSNKFQQNHIILKISGKYCLFFEQQHRTHTRYFNQKLQFIVSPSFSSGFQLVNKKFRLYKTVILHKKIDKPDKKQFHQYIKIYCIKNKDSQSKEQISVKRQNIRVQWKKSFIGRKLNSNGFVFINLFKYAQLGIITVYDFFNIKKFLVQTLEPDSYVNQSQWVFDQEQLLLNKSLKMKAFQGDRNNICEAEEFLQHTLDSSKHN